MKVLGEQIRYATDVIEARRHIVDAGRGPEAVERRAKVAAQYGQLIMQILVSLIVLIAAIILLFREDEATQKIASGLIGTVVGYWLR